ncbi:MAG: ABC transporter permease [Acidobacteriota bacterium]
MLAYQIRMAFLSLRRNPVLSALLVGGIALGMAVATTFVNIHHLLAQDPLPSKSPQVFHVQVDAWNPNRSYDEDNPDEPPDQLTYRDAMAIQGSDIPTYRSAMFKAQMTVHPAAADLRPFRAMGRLSTADVFPMFAMPFQFGAGWSRSADEGEERVVVLSFDTNIKLFGGEDSVGRRVRIEEEDFQVVGVLAPWQPSPKFYDVTNGPYNPSEEIYLPISLAEPMEVRTAGNTNGWKFQSITNYQERLDSELTWLQLWVQLDDLHQKERFETWLNAYAMQQKELGRMERPVNNRVRTVTEWLDNQEVVPAQAMTLTILSLLFLLVCAVNLIGILLGKFLARAPEVGVRRALGASKLSVFLHHLVECQLIGVLGCVVGLPLAILTLTVTSRLISAAEPFRLTPEMALVGVLLALFAALVAGVYPAWRICRIPPATYLKLQ